MHGACWNHFSVWRIALVADFWQKKTKIGAQIQGQKMYPFLGPSYCGLKHGAHFWVPKMDPERGPHNFTKLHTGWAMQGLYLETCLGAAAAWRMLPWVGLGWVSGVGALGMCCGLSVWVSLILVDGASRS